MSTEMLKSHIQFRMGTITREVRTAEELDSALQVIDSNDRVSETQRSLVRVGGRELTELMTTQKDPVSFT
jgi:hypothetical protein